MRKTIYKKRIATNQVNKFLDVELSYNEKKFRFSVLPIEIDGMFEKYRGFSGRSFTVSTVDRFSKKASEEALNKAKQYESDVIKTVCEEEHLTIA